MIRIKTSKDSLICFKSREPIHLFLVKNLSLVINEVVESYEVSSSNLNRDKNMRCFLPICSILGGQSYLLHVISGRWQVSFGTNLGERKLAHTPGSYKKRDFFNPFLELPPFCILLLQSKIKIKTSKGSLICFELSEPFHFKKKKKLFTTT